MTSEASAGDATQPNALCHVRDAISAVWQCLGVEVQLSDGIAFLALFVASCALGYTYYRDRQNRTARPMFHLAVNRPYKKAVDENGTIRIGEEEPPRTNLLIRNMASRPTAIIKIQAKNSSGAILTPADGKGPGADLPMPIEPWGVRTIETTWVPGEHTEGIYFWVKDIDDNEFEVHPSTQVPRCNPGDDVLAMLETDTAYVNVDGKYWERLNK